uniref:Uncharacterized protein n=1 Tax=Panagrolaimus superbus TaxID=310955 RepID=A0A914YY72_9BILA
MNKSQKRFQDFNNSSSSQPKGLDPKFAKLDMDLIRTMPPPPIPKMILEENQKNLLNQSPALSSTVRYRAPNPNLSNTGPPQRPPSSGIIPLQRPPQNINGNVIVPTRLPPPPQPSTTAMPRPEIRPSNSIRPGTSFPPPQRPNNVQPGAPPLPRMNNNHGPFPPQQIRPSNMQRPPSNMLRPSIPAPDSSSIMRTLFSALHHTTPSSSAPPPQQQMPPRLPPPQHFRPPINQGFMPRMPRMPPRGGPPRFRPRR